MSRTVGILFVFWFCIFSVSEAALGASCNETDTSNCTATNEKCIDDSCKCSTGYFNVSNTCNSSSITVTLTTQSISVVYGSNVTLIASITSEVPLNTSNTFKWLKGPTDGSLIEFVLTPSKYTQNDVGQVTLTIQNVNFTDTGAYQVKVGNIAGTTNTSNQVSINVTGERPTVVVPGTITDINTTVTIHCTASGSPALTSVYWLLNATNLDVSDSTKYTGGTVSNPSLSIHNIASTDAGEYRCVATNLVGSTTSTKSVTLAPPSSVSISQQPANPVYNGTRITVSGSYTSTLLNVKGIKWQRMNGNAFSDIDITADKYKESTDKGSNPTLVITKVDFTDRTSFRLTVSNGVGIMSSEAVYLNVIDGSISVTLTPPSSSARLGSDVILTAMITSTASVNLTKWQKVLSGGNPENLDISLPKYTQNDVGQGTVTLTIHNVTFTDMGAYQVEVSNAAGNTGKSNQVSFSVRAGQFNESCTNQQPCDTSQNLECTTINRCRCTSAFYYKDQVCNEKSGLVPINIGLNSTTSGFSVFWNNPTTDDYELVSGYEVNWKVPGGSWKSSNQLDRTVNKYTPSSNLIPGQLYTVKVISHVTLTNPADSFVVTSSDTTVRTVPLAPGSIVTSQSNFTHNDLQIKWTAPVNTVVTKYEVILNDTTYTTMSNDTMYHFNGKVFVPGKSYVISIVTVSGTTSDIVKKSSEHTEWIRTTPTKPNPPTNLQCPQSPLDVSLEISWTAPVKPNGLILGYQIDVSPGNLQFYTSSNETHKNVEGLLPEQMYTFAVRTINDAVDNTSESNQSLTCKTKAGVSTSPTNLNIDEIQSRGFRIQFNRPDNVSGVLAAYKILISQGGDCVQQILVYGNCSNCKSTVDCQLINYTVPNITNNNVSYTAGGLMPYTHYMVKVVAINGKGEGHPVNETVTTDEEVPLQPEQITASNIQPNSLTLTWTLPDPSPGNTTYTIYTYEGTDDVGKSFLMNKSTKVYGFDTKTLSVTGLEEYWPYKFNVTATTVKGDNTSDFSSVFRTKQAAPGQVLNLTIDQRGSDYKAAYVSWSPPALRDHNGVLESYLFSSNHTGTMEVKEMSVLSQATVEKKIPVTPEAVYVIEVILKNNENMESQPSIQTYKAPAGPPPVTNIEPVSTSPGEQPTTNTLTIDINTEYFKNDENGKQVFFGIAVCAKSKCEDKTVMAEITLQHDWKDLPNWHMASKDGFPLYRVTNDTFMDKVRKGDSRWKRSTINASVIKFKIGEDATCPFLNANVYCNGHLSAGISYNVIIFACTNGGCTYSEADGAFSTQRIPEEEDTNINIIIGVVVAVVVAAVIVGVAFVVVKRRNRLGETKQYTKGIENPSTFDEPVPKNIPRKRPIKLKELCDKVAEKHKDSNLHFAREYEDLKALSPKHPAETSELDSNKLKNRYVNILPFDHSRVKLMLTEDDDPSTDFINANYLPGYKSQREYIATQGPIPGTIDDFWRMIWEQNVSIIVMLTLCKEEGRVKCEMYWPENIHEPKQYGDLVVETVSNSTVNFYEFRIFKIKLGDTTRSVKHFHFLQWKDFSANVQNDVMIDFIKNVRNHIRPPDMNGPVVVHCSAGVGRTGTYCALDHLFQFVDEHDLDESIDIFDLVMNLRERRMFMVQTEQQYVFIHDCVRDYVERKKKELQGNLLYENVNRGFVADEDPMEESLYQNYSNQRTDL